MVNVTCSVRHKGQLLSIAADLTAILPVVLPSLQRTLLQQLMGACVQRQS
jgi:hypothetical protein